ncbi:MAG: sulfurtransferase, partial [Pseudomonadota bacterium]
ALPLPAGTIALLADDAEVTALAAADLAAAGHGPIVLIEGGFAAWRDAGLPLADDTAPADEDSIDFLFFVHDRHDGNLDSSRRYLAWEQALIEQLDADGRAAFRIRP